MHDPQRNQSTAYTVYGTVYTCTWIRISHARATYHESVRYGIGTCTRYAIHILYTVGKLPYNGKCWRGFNLAKWPETALFFNGELKIWRIVA